MSVDSVPDYTSATLPPDAKDIRQFERACMLALVRLGQPEAGKVWERMSAQYSDILPKFLEGYYKLIASIED